MHQKVLEAFVSGDYDKTEAQLFIMKLAQNLQPEITDQPVRVKLSKSTQTLEVESCQ
jgi:hypothetical protein